MMLNLIRGLELRTCILFRPVRACSGLFDQFDEFDEFDPSFLYPFVSISELIFGIFQSRVLKLELWYVGRTTVDNSGHRTS